MEGEFIKKALCFHGKPMQKIWDDERGVGDLQMVGVPDDGNYSIYNERQKYFTFQDRAKRLKLHQFLARKSNDLYDKDLGRIPAKPIKVEQDADDKNSSILAQVPPYETFLTKHQDKVKRYTLESIKTGDIIYAVVTRGRSGTASIPLGVKPLCTSENNFKLLHEYKIKSIIPSQLCGPPTVDKLGTPRYIEPNDYVRCEVIDFSIDAERMTLSLMPNPANKDQKLGKILPEELPLLYCKYVETSGMERFEGYLSKAKEFENPNYDILYGINGLSVNDNFTLMSSLKNGFPSQEYAKELRQIQASKWAFRSVAEGIEFFKIGQHVEAFQCLNKALNIDPRNVEGLVARGALYANKGSFLKAVEDFEKALKLNAFHVNARKYMGETLVALGRSYEEDNRIQDAAKAYRDCLNIIPKHEQATMLLDVIQRRTGASVEVVPPPLKIYEKTDQGRTSSLSNGSGSEDDSSDSSSDSEEEILSANKREGSLSPLSKKMALHAQQMECTGRRPPFQQPFYMSQTGLANSSQPQVIPNEFKLDEDDTESRVRKLLQDASKHKKDKKKTKKSKKPKKSKKSSKSSKELAKDLGNEINYLGAEILTRENALNENLKQYEKSIQELKKRQLKLSDQPSTSSESTARRGRPRDRSETPPPPPSIKPSSSQSVGPSKYHTVGFRQFSAQTHSSRPIAAAQSSAEPETHKFSFQIKKPTKVDKFGLIRLATPAINKSPTPPPPAQKRRERLRSQSPKRSRSRKRSPSRRRSGSRSRSKSRIRRRSRTRSRSVGRRRRWHSRTRSRSRGRYEGRGRGRRSRSYTRSSSRSGSYADRRKRDPRSRSRSRRRHKSPFGSRDSPSPRRHSRRSPMSPRGGGRRGGRARGSSRGGPPVKFGNRVWKNPNAEVSPDKSKKPSSSDDRWPHDKFENPSDDPTIEEIDEIISKAQKERKQNIINNDKHILKKSNKW